MALERVRETETEAVQSEAKGLTRVGSGRRGRTLWRSPSLRSWSGVVCRTTASCLGCRGGRTTPCLSGPLPPPPSPPPTPSPPPPPYHGLSSLPSLLSLCPPSSPPPPSPPSPYSGLSSLSLSLSPPLSFSPPLSVPSLSYLKYICLSDLERVFSNSRKVHKCPSGAANIW